MRHDQRVIYASTDISAKVNDFRAGTQSFSYTTGTYLYVAAVLPFNHLWFEMGTVNATAAITPTIEIWFGNAWVPAVDVIDETLGLTLSGRLSWATDRLKGWDPEQSSEDVTGVTSFKIYNMFWLRISWSANFTGSPTLKYVGQKFSTDDTLYSYYPNLNNSLTLTSFESGKTDWNEQHYMAAEQIVKDLRKRNLIESRAQVLDWTLFEDASCHKVAEIVYTPLGNAYLALRQEAEAKYKAAMNMQFHSLDKNADGNLSREERRVSTSSMTR